MKLCSSYKISVYLWEKLDEIRFTVPSLARAVAFMDNHPDTKVIIEVLSMEGDQITKEQIYDLIQEYKNLYFDFYDMNDLLDVCNDARRWMYHFPATTYNMLYLLMNLPISDITINEPLTFDLENLKSIRDRMETKVNFRVNPAVGRPDLFNKIKDKDDGLNHFFVLPQHMEAYDEYFDVLDILDNIQVREETLVKVFLKKQYHNELKYFLRNSDSDLFAELIDKDFIKRRLTCHQACMQGIDSYKCHFCHAQAELYALVRKHLEEEHQETESNQPVS